MPETKTPVTETKEDVFEKILGHFGRWQLLIFLSVFLVKFSSGWVQMAIIFLTPNLTFWCSDYSNTTLSEVKNNTCYDDCNKYSYDTYPFDNTIISEWDLICEKRWLASFTQTVLQLGILIGSIVFGFFSDRYGRKITFLVSVTGLTVIWFGVPFSPNYWVFTGLRFMLGMAAAGTMVVSFVIVMEAVGSKHRGVAGCLFQLPFIFGHMTTPLFAYFYRDWKSFSLAMAVPHLLYLGYFLVISESPRWLLSVGRVEEAARIVEKAAVLNKRPAIKIEESLREASKSRSSSEQKVNYVDLFRGSLMKKTVCCCIIWLITGGTFFGLNQYIGQTSPSPFISVAVAGAIQIPSNFIAVWLIDRFGRKIVTICTLALGGLSIITLGCVAQLFWLTLTLGSLGVSCMSIVASTIYIYTSELYPTVVRNMGIGVGSTFMRVGSMLAPFISNLTVTVDWLPTVIFGLAPIVAGLVCLYLPETKGMSLKDSIDEEKQDIE